MSEPTPAVLPQLPWTQGERARLAAALRAGRLPHALLIHEAPGAGGEWLAFWTAQLALCEHRDEAPCGRCAACRRVAARAHPDLLILAPEEDSSQIRIEQVRELGAELALTSHGGGYKVGVVSPADGLNRFAANALLKTLEEPPARTLLILVATQPSRLPATILSRCQRLKVAAPSRAASLTWLTAAGGEKPWGPALDTLGEAPLTALDSDPEAVAEAADDTRRTLEAFLAGTADPAATAERWTRSELPLRLRATENWLTDRIRRGGSGGRLMPELRGGPHLSGGRPVLNIRELFRLVDEVRELRATLDVPLNRGVALEALFRRLAP
ncbi:MAG: DNA polymerase III subunit delta' [Proteobacteria bacterium]|nr:DNA polymerase III subunit delta' [Pseudomonadota bacterium]